MIQPDSFRINAVSAEYRPNGEVSLEQGIELIVTSIEYSRINGHRKLLIDITGLYGFSPPTFLDRFRLGIMAAEAARSKVIVAVLAPTQLIDYEKIGAVVARNRGMVVDIFTSEADALSWLAAA